MLQVPFIRANTELVKERLSFKYFKNTELVDQLLELDDKRRKMQSEKEELLSKANGISKEIGQLMKEGKKDAAEQKKADVKALNEKVADTAALSEMEKAIYDILVQFPNLPAAVVPPGKTPEENVEVRKGGSIPVLHAGAVPHWDLAKNMT